MEKGKLHYFDLHHGEEDKARVLETVRSGVSFRGANLWILSCAIVVASIGLNVNSAAVIIGAMLISPLMGPIIGAGFGIGTFDFELLKKSLRNLFVATVVSLTVSSLYFLLSPFKETQSELLNRTSPNIYDILIAFFGGLVGVIAITRVEKGNPIPGVAIATALMPPLCTAGYGLAVGNWRFFAGALYLYTINCVFICLATFVIVKYLKYPRFSMPDKKKEKRVALVMTVLTMSLLVPSVYFAYVLFQEKKYTQQAQRFIQAEFSDKGYAVIYKKIEMARRPKSIEVGLLSKTFDLSERTELRKKMAAYGLAGTKLYFRQDTTDLKREILNELQLAQGSKNEKDQLIAQLQERLNQNRFDQKQLLAEMKAFFPEVKAISVSNHEFSDGKTQCLAVIYQSAKTLTAAQEKQLADWMRQRLQRDCVEMYHQNPRTE